MSESPTKRDDMPALSHFLENSTHDMQRDAIRAYALQYAQQRVREEREAIINEIPGGSIVDPQWVCDMIRARKP